MRVRRAALDMAQPLPESFACASRGIAHTCATGRNFKIQLGFAVAAIVLGIAFSIDVTQWAVISICIGCVLGGECMNTALESIVDLASPGYHDLAKHAKDCAAGAVLVCSFGSLFVAAFIFLPKILALLPL